MLDNSRKINILIDMKKYALVECYPAGNNSSGNHVINECLADTKEHAIELLQASSPVKLNAEGYAKFGDSTYVIAEAYESFSVPIHS